MADKTAIVGIRQRGTAFDVIDAIGRVHSCPNETVLWRTVAELVEDPALPAATTVPVEEDGKEADLEDIENFGHAIADELGPVAQAAAPLVFRRVGGWLRKLSR